ncbi:hypothetical protein Tco_0071396 [Tanacetum coccineum]
MYLHGLYCWFADLDKASLLSTPSPTNVAGLVRDFGVYRSGGFTMRARLADREALFCVRSISWVGCVGLFIHVVLRASPNFGGPGLLRVTDRRSESTSFSDSSTTLPPLVPRKAPPQLAPLLNLLISSSS